MSKAKIAGADALDPLERGLERARELLPAQGPIGVFVHHNTLHAFEDLPFEDAVRTAADVYDAQPFMSLAFYQGELEKGRITRDDLEAVIREDLPEPQRWGSLGERDFKLNLLLWPRLAVTEEEVDYFLEEKDLLQKFLPGVGIEQRERIRLGSPRFSEIAALKAEKRDAQVLSELWETIALRVQQSSRGVSPSRHLRPQRLSELVREKTERDAEERCRESVIAFTAAYLDQGLAYWPMPDRSEGLYLTFCSFVRTSRAWSTSLSRAVRRLVDQDFKAVRSAESSLRHSLQELGHPEDEWEDILVSSALALPGWTGLIARLELEPELAPLHCPELSLLEFLAVRLLEERAALECIAEEEWGFQGSLRELRQKLSRERPRAEAKGAQVLSLRLFRAAQWSGLSVRELEAIAAPEFEQLLSKILTFDDREQRRLFHLAYERNSTQRVLQGLQAFRRDHDPAERRPARYQAIFCMDDRCESIRRHLEELSPVVETYGTGGFFGVAVSYRGIDDGYHADLCPVVQKPAHQVNERGVAGQSAPLHSYLVRRKLFSSLLYGSYKGTRGLARGFFATFGLGVLSILPLSLRVLFPRATSRATRFFSRFFFPKPETELSFERKAGELGSLDLFLGFSTPEMTDRIERLLRDIGLTQNFGALVTVVGHGSSSINNPLASAYDCGACGGGKGGPNARLFAQMANNRQVRALLKERGIDIPETTVFVGGYHDTASDAVTWFDRKKIPETHEREFEELLRLIDQARKLDAQERCRRFETAPLGIDPTHALAHVEGRTEDLAQPRPELGHAMNLVAIFGRRGLTRGLFLDRRAFLISYDPTTDAEGEILGRLLAALGPVGAGINLEYYFSRVDNERYGCGTKLPHNVVGLLGVMSGSQSDLRTGLPSQMIEVHEPVRLLVVVEASEETIGRVIEKHPAVAGLVEKRWILFSRIDPTTGEIYEYTKKGFVPLSGESELAVRANSTEWYKDSRDHLPLAVIRKNVEASASARGGWS